MRSALALVLPVLVAAASPASAQGYLTSQQTAQMAAQAELRLGELQAQADMARQREIATSNQLMSLEARLQTERALADVRAQSYTPRLPPVTAYQAYPGAPLPAIDTSQLASIPDSALAQSNDRVKAASQNRR